KINRRLALKAVSNVHKLHLTPKSKCSDVPIFLDVLTASYLLDKNLIKRMNTLHLMALLER
ncbi:unnamed protein product, partial [Tenebrio molitor]